MTLESSNRPIEITGIVVFTPSYIPDLIIQTKNPIPNSHACTGLDTQHLCRDEVFLKSVIAHLRTLGYTGEEFGRGELGAQGDFEVSMEPGQDFFDFVKDLGWEKPGKSKYREMTERPKN